MTRNVHNTSASSFSKVSMARYACEYGLQPADRLIEPIFQTGFTKHHALYLGMDQYGKEWIAENHKLYGVRIVNANEFFQPGKSFTVTPFIGTNTERMAAVQRAMRLLNKPYDLINYNCEHYASYVQTGKAESSQVNNVILSLFALLFIGFAVD